MLLRSALLLALAAGLSAQTDTPPDPDAVYSTGAIFGTSVVIPAGLSGTIYFISRFTKDIPDVLKSKPRGTIYTTSLNVPKQSFSAGFPGVTKRNEWFAIDYTGNFWVEKAGDYRFSLTSDDGSMLYIDDRQLIDNGGLHPPTMKGAVVALNTGAHKLRVMYFQGPKFEVALVLKVAGPGLAEKIFNVDDFKPPSADAIEKQ